MRETDELVRLIPATEDGSVAAPRVLFVTNMWPDEERPWYGTFINTQRASLEAIGVPVDVLYIRGYRTPRAYARAIARAIRLNGSPRWDVVHAHYGHSAAVARFIARRPLVVSYCGDDLLGTPASDGGFTRRSRVEAALFRRLAHVAAATITKSQAMEQILPRACVKRNHVIPNGVDVERFRPIDREEARRLLDWPPDERVALFAGNPSIPRKNYALAVEACDALRNGGPPPTLRVAWGIEPEAMPLWMSAADALVLPSISEGSPNVVKEAMACELPVVATPVGDVPERLSGVPGCHVVPPRTDVFADALGDALRFGRSREAREQVSELSLARIAERVRDVYDTVLEGR